MMQNYLENNVVNLFGQVSSEIEFNHKIYGEGFYNFYLKVHRLSESSDLLPITVSERLLEDAKIKEGDYIEINGQFRSYNNYTQQGNKLILTVFARDILVVNGSECQKSPNTISLNGYVCKKPIFRTTPFGREITDILIAVNRSYNKSDYIPCIAWGRNARYAEKLNVGDNVKIVGRIQSREYQKKGANGQAQIKTAFEVSINKIL